MNDPWFEWWATQQVWAMKAIIVMIPLFVLWAVVSIFGKSKRDERKMKK